MTRQIRVTVTANAPDFSSDDWIGDLPPLMKEWAHQERVDSDEAGITLRYDGIDSVFFPWTTIVRVDREPCDCMDCRQ